MMRRSGDVAGTAQSDFEAWSAFLRSSFGDRPEDIEPNAIAAWIRPLSVCGLAAAALKIRCGYGSIDPGRNSYRSERTHQDVRTSGADWYYVVFQVAGRSALTQNDHVVQLAVGDVALFDAARPATCFASSAQWLALQLPRQSLFSHLGFEPQGGLYGRGGTRAARLLFQLVLDGIEEEDSVSATVGRYMQLAFYDLLGALFGRADPRPISHHTDKLFARISEIIKDRFADPNFGPCEVAAAAGISLRYVQKLFTARGSTCSDFLYDLRLDHAARLLQRRAALSTGRPLSEIAYACGFRDYVHFARKFRSRFGFSPGAYVGGDGRSVASVGARPLAASDPDLERSTS